MTKTEAIAAMERGEKVRHTYFTPEEYVYLVGREVYCEDGAHIHSSIFWMDRMGKSFEDGWSIYQPETGALAD